MKNLDKALPYKKIAPFYDYIFAAWGKDYAGESKRIHRIIQKNKKSLGNTLLDLGCGTGEHIRYLQDHYAVSGLDISKEMIEIAKIKLPNAKFWQEDMKSFYLGSQFDVIISLFGAISYIKTEENLDKTIKCMVGHLKSGGVAIIEPWYTPEQFEVNRFESMFGEKENLKACRMREGLEINGTAVIKDHLLITIDGSVTYFTSKHKFGLFTPSQLLDVLNRHRLKVGFMEKGLTDRGLYIAVK
jgi:SAM-dependent methyltransferase